MDSTHLHLILNHFPIIGTIIATGVMAYGFFTQSDATKKAALFTWVVMALVAIPVFLTGEPAEESVEGLAGVSEAIIEQHEEAAEIALWVMEALGLLSLATLFLGFKNESIKKLFTRGAFALSLVTFGMMAYTGGGCCTVGTNHWQSV
jgi:uncharacterized membrane protein